MATQGIRLDRADRKEMIHIMLNESSSDWHTSHTIAKLIKMKPSTHLRSLLNEMVEEGRLHVHKVWTGTGLDWSITERPKVVYYALPHRDHRKDMYG